LWWRMITSIRRGVGVSEGSWFEDNVCRVVGGGGTIFFWSDNLVGGVPLRVQFPRLFDLAVDKWVTVQQMECRGWTDGGGAWEWRRRLLAWEEETLSECAFLLHNVVLQDHILDRWRWMLDPINGYSVKGTYTYPTMPNVPSERGRLVDLWKKQVPLRSLFLFGDCFAIESQLKTTLFIDVSFLPTTLLALLDAVLLRPRIIFYFIVIISVWCGTISISG